MTTAGLEWIGESERVHQHKRRISSLIEGAGPSDLPKVKRAGWFDLNDLMTVYVATDDRFGYIKFADYSDAQSAFNGVFGALPAEDQNQRAADFNRYWWTFLDAGHKPSDYMPQCGYIIWERIGK